MWINFCIFSKHWKYRCIDTDWRFSQYSASNCCTGGVKKELQEHERLPLTVTAWIRFKLCSEAPALVNHVSVLHPQGHTNRIKHCSFLRPVTRKQKNLGLISSVHLKDTDEHRLSQPSSTLLSHTEPTVSVAAQNDYLDFWLLLSSPNYQQGHRTCAPAGAGNTHKPNQPDSVWRRKSAP